MKNTPSTPPVGMRAVTRTSALPIYALGLVWLVWALLFPLYSVTQFALCLVLSLAVFFLLKKCIPPTVTYEKIPPVETGDTEADALLRTGEEQLAAIAAAASSIENAGVREKLAGLQTTCRRILDYVQGHPKSAPGLRKFLNYYLPTLKKLTETYALMESQKVEGENITASLARIDQMLDTMDAAFEKQLDALFGDTALDVDTDITVMEGMLAQEGLSDSPSPTTQPAPQPAAPRDGDDGSIHLTL